MKMLHINKYKHHFRHKQEQRRPHIATKLDL